MNTRVFIPSDPDQRRKLWREWVHTDTPQSAPPARTIPAPRVVPIGTEAPSHTASPASTDWLPEAIDAPASVIHGLKRAIAECVVGGTLSITDRQRLIARSMKLGLSRFEANLLIAAVQNRSRQAFEAEAPASAGSDRPWGIGLLLAIVLAAEMLAGAVAWRAFF